MPFPLEVSWQCTASVFHLYVVKPSSKPPHEATRVGYACTPPFTFCVIYFRWYAHLQNKSPLLSLCHAISLEYSVPYLHPTSTHPIPPSPKEVFRAIGLLGCWAFLAVGLLSYTYQGLLGGNWWGLLCSISQEVDWFGWLRCYKGGIHTKRCQYTNVMPRVWRSIIYIWCILTDISKVREILYDRIHLFWKLLPSYRCKTLARPWAFVCAYYEHIHKISYPFA